MSKHDRMVKTFAAMGYKPAEKTREYTHMTHTLREGIAHRVYCDGTVASYVNGRLVVPRDDERVCTLERSK